MNSLEFSVTFAVTTPESAENGDYAETGFEHESLHFDTFSELVWFLEQNDYCQANGYPCVELSDHDWISTDSYTTCYKTGRQVRYSIRSLNSRATRYLNLAAKYLKIIG